ncbi:MAG: FkbM family methyltransferase [Syntrophobacterales bacterium]|jgi:FkbM family methyltransferase|nr:FkbM family methyltransferase [Syntrophobacterales bacterium]
MRSIKLPIKRYIKKIYIALSIFLPDVYLPFPSAGGKIFLNLKESPSQFSRAIGQYEVLKKKTIVNLLKPGKTFIDVGANMGDYTLMAAKIVGETGKVMSIEPAPNNIKWINKSIKLNGYPNITVKNIALGETDGMAKLYLSHVSGWHSLIPSLPNRNQGDITVEVKTLDNLLKNDNCNNVDMIKIDVEGAELKVLKGSYQTLTKNHDIIVLVDIHPTLGVDPNEVGNSLRELGFDLYQMVAPFNIPLNVDGNTTEILAYRKRNYS